MSSIDKITNSENEPLSSSHQPEQQQQPKEHQNQHKEESAQDKTDEPSNKESTDSSNPPVKKRVRTGCLNCRRKHKKCDEAKPICTTCSSKNEICEWPNPNLKKSTSKSDLYNGFNHFPQHILPYSNPLQGPIVGGQGFPAPNELQFKRQRLDVVGSHSIFSGRLNSQQQSLPVASGLPTGLTHPLLSHQSNIQNPLPFDTRVAANSTTLPYPWNNPSGSSSSSVNGNTHNVTDNTIQRSSERMSSSYLLNDSAAFKESELFLQNYMAKYEVPSVLPALTNTPNITEEDEVVLMRYFIEHLSSQFDILHVNNNEFRNVIPSLAKYSDALRYSILALSLLYADSDEDSVSSTIKESPLTIFELAVAHLVKNSATNSNTMRVAAGVLLVSFCMKVTEGSRWRASVQSLASFVKSEDVRPVQRELTNFSIFWVVALMDVCTTQLMKEKTLMTYDFESLRKFSLIPQMIAFLSMTFNLLVLDGSSNENFDSDWERLWLKVSQWGEQVEEEQLDFVKEIDNSPFPIILCHSATSALSNQIYLTAKILLMQDRPRLFKNRYTDSHPLAWYAKRICALNQTNPKISNWLCSPLCLWTAGKVLTHEDEHSAVLDLLTSVENKLGPLSRSRSQDLRDFWEGRVV